MNFKEIIASRITQARKAKGITIKELSIRTETLSPARISNWEQGTRSPGPEEAKLLSKSLDVAASWLLNLTDNPKGEWIDHIESDVRYIPVLNMQYVLHAKEILGNGGETSHPMIVADSFNPSITNKNLFAVKVGDNSMFPDFNSGDIIVIDVERSPEPGDYVLVYLTAKKQTVLRKYSEANGCLFQLLASNDLWAMVSVQNNNEATIIGVGGEIRRFV